MPIIKCNWYNFKIWITRILWGDEPVIQGALIYKHMVVVNHVFGCILVDCDMQVMMDSDLGEKRCSILN